MITVGIITVSDRASRGQYEDKSGPALRQFCEQQDWRVTRIAVAPDERTIIGDTAVEFAKTNALVLLTGGTGIATRDVTPEAVRAVADKELPGFGEAMRMNSFEKFPNAILSRSLAVVVGKTLVIGLPGSPKAAVECLGFVAAAIPHALELLDGNTAHI